MPYFDHNATAPLLPAAREAWLAAAESAWANPSSPHRAGARAHRVLADARERLAALLARPPERIVFTAGATEGNNAVLAWLARVLPAGRRLALAPTEHPSVREAARAFFGPRLATLPVDYAGIVSLELPEDAGAVSVMAANNETGVLGPLASVAEACVGRGIPFHCDATQWFGRLPSRALPASALLVGGAHKFGGPKGVGFLVLPAGAEAFAGALGGAQEDGRRGGTENIPAIVAMVAALEACELRSDEERVERAAWRDAAAAAIEAGVPGAAIVGGAAPRLWNTLSLHLPAHANTRWVARLDRVGCEVSTGSACAAGAEAPSHVLAALGFSAEEAGRTIRISSGWDTSAADWDRLVAAVLAAWRALETEAGGSFVVGLGSSPASESGASQEPGVNPGPPPPGAVASDRTPP